MELLLTGNNDSYFLSLVANYTRSEQRGDVKVIQLSSQFLALNSKDAIKLPQLPCIITFNEKILTNVFAIA